MKIKPVPFNYKDYVKDYPNTEVKVQRVNVVLDNDIVGMWGQKVDEEEGIMLLTSISMRRDHSKETKETLVDLWETTLNQYSETCEEMEQRIEEKRQKELERQQKAEEAARKAEEKAAKAKETLKAKEAKEKDKNEKVS